MNRIIRHCNVVLALLAACFGCTLPNKCPPGETTQPDAGEEVAPLDHEQLAKDMEAVRDELARKLQDEMGAMYHQLWPDFTVDPRAMSWTYALSSRGEVLLAEAPGAREEIAAGRVNQERDIGLVFLRVDEPDKQGWSKEAGYWAKLWFIPPAFDPTTGRRVPGRFEIRAPGTPGTPDITIARGNVEVDCAECGGQGDLGPAAKVKIRFTCKLAKPVEIDVEIEFDKDKNQPTQRTLVHMQAALELLPTTGAQLVRKSALGLPFAQAIDGAKLTKADAAVQSLKHAVQKKWLPANVRVGIDALTSKQWLLLRNRDAGDLDNDGRNNFTLDFLDWAPLHQVADDGSPKLLNLKETNAFGLLFLSLPRVNGPAECPWCVRKGARGFLVARRSYNLFDAFPCILSSLDEAAPDIPVAATAVRQSVSPGETLAAVGSLCMFKDDDCDMYELSMAVEGAQLVIKTKSVPP